MRKRQPWESALSKFLESWKKRKDVIGALVSGSLVFGTGNQYSDIDVHIVLTKGSRWRERGNCIVDGYLIEYFCNSLKQLEEYRREEVTFFTHIDARMFSLGRIIFDKTGDLKKLQQKTKRELKTKFRKLDRIEIELGKYGLWDDLDNLKDLWKRKSPYYAFSHHLLLHRTLELYRRYIGDEVSSSAKLERYFSDEEFRRRYGIPKFSDEHFVKLFMKGVFKPTLSNLNVLIDYVLKQMGGFDIDGWKLRSKSLR